MRLPGARRRRGTPRDAANARRPGAAAGDELLDADLLRQLERLRLDTLTEIVAGLVGERHGRARVAQLEFADYRPYVAGDELRRIDWNIYRRLHQLAVRVGIEDGRLALALLVDVSRSMRTGEPAKLGAAKRLAAALAAIALLRGDEATVHALGDGRARTVVRLAGPAQVAAVARALAGAPVSQRTSLEDELRDVARTVPRTDLMVLISDASVTLDELERSLRILASSAGATAFLHVVAPDELETAVRGPIALRDAETGRVVETVVDDADAQGYAARVGARLDGVRDRCSEASVGYVRVRSDAEVLDVLLAHARAVGLSVA